MMFVHLSDLHFRSEEIEHGGNPDVDIRNELLRDLESLQDRIPSTTGILVTGDVAFAGRKDEYEAARVWLRQVCEVVGTEPENVWVVPGNHDVDHSAITENIIVRDFHRNLRTKAAEANKSEVERFFTERVNDLNLGELLLTPLENYNEFALGFQCETTRESLTWHYDFPLNDGSKLRLHGLNSAILSDNHDNNREYKLYLGIVQTQFELQRENGIAHAVLCHHPPDWLFDQDHVDTTLNNRAALHLFGHKHVQRIQTGQRWLRVYSGALHPRRGAEPWDPRYNILEVGVSGRAEDRTLQTTLWQRQWSPQRMCFVPNRGPEGNTMRTISLRLESWSPTPTKEDPSRDCTDKGSGDASSGAERVPSAASAENPRGQAMSEPSRSVVYRFFELAYHERIEIIVKLGLLRDEDRDLPEIELLERVFARVREGNLMERLSNLIDAHLRARIDRT